MKRLSLGLSLLLPFSLLGLAASGLSEARRLMHTGSYSEAERLLREAPDTDPESLRLRLELARRKGDRDSVERLARRLLQLHEMGRLQSVEAVGQAAYAAWQLDLWEDANQLFMEAAKLGPLTPPVAADWGNLYLEKYRADEAEPIFREGLQAAPATQAGLDDLYVGLAGALKAQSKPGTAEALQKALELNPQNLQACALHASLALQEEDHREASRWIERGLTVNRNYLPLLELRCALYYFRDDSREFARSQQQVLEVNPQNGDLFEKLGDVAMSRRRLNQAVEFYRESVRRNPRQWSALASLGINLLRLGREEEGKQVLEKAYQNDPFNPWTVNTLRLVDSFERFVRYQTPHFLIRLHEKEAGALHPYVIELAEKSVQALQRKYDHQVEGPYLLELYPDHEDFAVRTLGMPGLGALGATFGRVVAMDSPSARRENGEPGGRFHWGSTLWHEVAHVVTLSLSRHKTPRWFTEGISMMEERQAAEGWGEYLTPDFLEAYKKGQLLALADLNSGFVRPKFPGQVEISYYQAGWICEFLASRYGFEKIRAMLVAFGENKSAEEVFQDVLDSSMEAVEEQFREEMDRVLKPLLSRLDSAKLREVARGEEGEDPAALLQAVQQYPDNYFLNLQAGRELHAAGRSAEAVPYLEKALQLFPTAASKGSPYDLLAQIHKEEKNTGALLRVLRQWWEMEPRFVENALELSALLAAQNRPQEATRYLEEAMYADPLDAGAHQKLGELYLEAGEAEKALREFRVVMSLQPLDWATAHYQLAEALYEAGQKEEARREVLLSLEIAPGYVEAQKLLLKLVRQ